MYARYTIMRIYNEGLSCACVCVCTSPFKIRHAAHYVAGYYVVSLPYLLPSHLVERDSSGPGG